MKKRIIVYGMVIILSVVASLLLKNEEESSRLLIYLPFRFLASLLENMSRASQFGNVLSWFLLIVISAFPLVIGIFILRKKMKLFDVISLFVLSLTLGLSIYYIINITTVDIWATQIARFQSVGNIKPLIASGIINVWLGLLLTYLVVRIFVLHRKLSQHFLTMLVVLVSYVLMVYIQALMEQSFAWTTLDQKIQSLSMLFDIASLIAFVTLVELMMIFIEHIKQNDVLNKLNKLTQIIKITTFVTLAISLSKLVMLNYIQLVSLDQMNHIAFNFSIDIISWLFIFFFYGLNHYIVHMNDVLEEAELTI